MATPAPRSRTPRRSAPARAAVNGETRKYHHGDLPGALMQAVAEIVRERGASAVSLREAARRANVSHGAPSHHFRSKTGMLTAFAADGYRKLEAALGEADDALGAGAGAADRLAACGEAYVHFATRNAEQFALMYRPDQIDAGDAALQQAADGPAARLSRILAACAAEGRIEKRDVEKLGVAAWSLVHGLATLWLGGRLAGTAGGSNPDALAAFVTRRFVEGLLGVQLAPTARKRKK